VTLIGEFIGKYIALCAYKYFTNDYEKVLKQW